jgi:hypothetical protein
MTADIVRAIAFLALAVSLAVDYAASLIGSTDKGAWDTVGFSVVYAVFVLGSLAAAERARGGKGMVLGLCMLLLILVEASLAIVLALTMGRSGYHAPGYVYATHIAVGVAYCASWIVLGKAMWQSTWRG